MVDYLGKCSGILIGFSLTYITNYGFFAPSAALLLMNAPSLFFTLVLAAFFLFKMKF